MKNFIHPKKKREREKRIRLYFFERMSRTLYWLKKSTVHQEVYQPKEQNTYQPEKNSRKTITSLKNLTTRPPKKKPCQQRNKLNQNIDVNVSFVTKDNIPHCLWELALSRDSTPNFPKNLLQNLLFSERLPTKF
jgi:hypothetical protein